MERIFIKETPAKIGKRVRLCGWVDTIRGHGKIIFIDLRDKSGIIQIVFSPGETGSFEKAKELRPEWVIAVEGAINTRPANMINNKIDTGRH